MVEVALLISRLPDMSGIEERGERKQCRSNNKPEFIIAGGMVKSHTTVIM